MTKRLDWLNDDCKQKSLDWRNAFPALRQYHHGMALPIRNFYLSEWLSYFNKSQAELSRELDWNKAKVSLLCSGKQEFYRDDLFALADALRLEPYELLLHPDKAMSLRRMIADLKRIAGQPVVSNVEEINILKKPAKPAKPAKRGTGTHG